MTKEQKKMPGLAYVKYDYLLRQSKYTNEDLFKYIVYLMQKGTSIVFDFYRLPGGPYGYALPASIVLDMQHGKVEYSGYPIILFEFPKKDTQEIVLKYLASPGFRRVSYMDSTGFKVLIARIDQISFPLNKT